MAGNIKGINIEIGGSTTKLNSALKNVDSTARDLNKRLKDIDRSLKFNPGNAELIAQKQRDLAQAVDNTSEKLKILKQSQEQARQALEAGELGQEKYDALTREILKTENQLERYKSQLDQVSQAETKNTQAMRSRKEQLESLESTQSKLEASAENLASKYELQVASLGNNATATQELGARQDFLQSAMRNSAGQVANLERQLELAKAEYGANSQEALRLEQALLQAKIQAQQFANEYANVGNKLKITSDKFLQAGETLTNAGRNMTQKVTVPLTALGGLAVKSAGDFEQAMTGVAKTIDMTSSEFEQMGLEIRAMARELPFAVEEIAGVAEAAGQLGVAKEDVLGFTKVMLDLGVSTNMSAEEASVAIARFSAVTGMSIKDADRMGAVLVEMGNNFATTEKEIMDMTSRLAGAGAQIGLTEAQIMGIATALSSVDIQAEAGGSAFSKLMINMQLAVATGSKELQAFAQVAGMTGEEFSRAFKDDAGSAISEFIQGLARIQAEGGDVIKTLDDMGIKEVRLRDAILKTVGASDQFSEAMKTAGQAWEENTALIEEAQKFYDTFNSKIQTTKNSLKDLGITIGNVLLPHIENFLDKIAELADKFVNLDERTQEIILKVVGFIALLGPAMVLLGTFAKIIGTVTGAFAVLKGGATAVTPAIMGLSKVFGLVGSAGKLLFGAVKALGVAFMGLSAPAMIAVGAIIALIGVGVALYKNWDAIKEKASEVWASVKESFSNGAESVKEAFSGMAESASEKFESIKESASGSFEGMAEKWSSFTEGISAVIDEIGIYIRAVQILFEWFFEWLGNKVQEIFGNVQEFLQPYIQAISDFFTGIFEGLAERFNQVKETISEIFSSIVSSAVENLTPIIEAISNIWEQVKSKTTEAWNRVKEIVTQAISPLVSFVSGIFTSIYNSISQIMSNVVNALRTAWETVAQTTASMLERIKGIVSEGFNAVVSFISETVGKIIALAGAFLNAGVTIIQNLVSGVSSKIGEVASTISNGIRNAYNQALDMASQFFSIGVSIVSGMVNGIMSRINAVADMARQVVARAIGAARAEADSHSPSRVMVQEGENWSEGLIVGMGNLEKDVAKKASSTVKGMNQNAFKELKKFGGSVDSISGDAFKIPFVADIQGVSDGIREDSEILFETVEEVGNKVKELSSKKSQETKDEINRIFRPLPDEFFTLGQNIIDRLIQGIASKLEALFAVVLQTERIISSISTTREDGSIEYIGWDRWNSAPDIRWYKTGGIFSSPSIIGVGEAGTEVVAPIDKLQKVIDFNSGSRVDDSKLDKMILLLEKISQKETDVLLDGRNLTNTIDRNLGRKQVMKERGR